MARTRMARTRLNPAPTVAVAGPLRPVRPLATPLARDPMAPIPLPSPSMRGLEATIAIAALAAAILLGLLR